jgi:alkylation response protein AidB-like acyl-CoA dehydrogenase
LLAPTSSIITADARKSEDIGKPTFQALQHRCAELYCQLELARSAVLSAFTRLDRGQDILRAASQCKALANDCYLHTSNEAVQMHGGMGITDELDIGLYLKRSRVCNQLLGDSSYHRDRYAKAGSL